MFDERKVHCEQIAADLSAIVGRIPRSASFSPSATFVRMHLSRTAPRRRRRRRPSSPLSPSSLSSSTLHRFILSRASNCSIHRYHCHAKMFVTVGGYLQWSHGLFQVEIRATHGFSTAPDDPKIRAPSANTREKSL